MKLIKTTLVALTVIIGFNSNAQETSSRKTSPNTQVRATQSPQAISFVSTPEQIATQRADELKAKVELTAEQYSKVKDLFLKVENRKSAINNVSEEEKTNALNDLQIMENKELDTILTPTQKKIVSAPKTTKTATNM